MLAPSANPPLSPAVRLVALLIGLVLLGGVTQFVAPQLLGPIWPWATTPFNARFLGAVYLAQLMAVGVLLVVNRAAPGRLVLPKIVLGLCVGAWPLDVAPVLDDAWRAADPGVSCDRSEPPDRLDELPWPVNTSRRMPATILALP